MRVYFIKTVFFLLLVVISGKINAQEKTGQPIDIVFCLDLSNSSNGLIDQFRNHLWDYWDFFAKCKPQPNYRIGVVAYARFAFGKGDGYSKVIADLGNNFDKLSNILYKIPSKTEKGDNYVGSALKTCLRKISWSKDPAAQKIIFLVGNGNVTNGPDDIDEVVDKIVSENITIIPIYITAAGETKAIQGWQRLSMKSKGKIASINLRNMYFDRLEGFDIHRFRALNRRFNSTYLYYGKEGKTKARMLKEEDNNIYIANTEGFRYRIKYKISEDFQRKNASWDLVDLYYKNPVAFMGIDRKSMNDTCRKMNNQQLKAYIIYKRYERKKMASLINDMLVEKEQYDKENGIAQSKNMPTLDTQSLKRIGEFLKEKGCACELIGYSD
jgi:hypothetical protein